MKRTRAVLEQFGLCLLLLAAALTAGAQNKQFASEPPGAGQQEREEPTFRLNVRLVNVFTTVTDSHGAPVANLTKNDFQVLEDGRPQTISVFDKESEMPLSIVLEVDTSESTRRDIKLEIASAKRFVRSIMRPVDRLSVFQITDNVDQLTRFSSDMKYIDRGIERLSEGAGTSLYDAIYLGADALVERQGRKVMVLITDGGDTTSHTDYANALRRAQQSEAIVYSVIVVPVEADAGRNLGGEHALMQISHDTGGKYYYASGVDDLDKAFRQISEELRTQYLLAYYPSRQRSDSSFRRISVVVTRKAPDGQPYQVRHRAGYYTTASK
ncbi:MAG TPA: VWA domain-containing protein [Candidatus Angelobacter sp.]|nr:VWA domain-containing protein [Candidatus Angelobacter sp.]